ncbi:CarboxypepD_reg-like domain-containing protein [Chitinophaga sp. YR627]|uniref:carboxypeptidase-like regulatory domain-containing protein n=1 Tax=Chitinophaga sp. YR627 TaxID=1881041 RepID=UPI0008E6AF97|nr:carboxypeptidase-like regulatory domain-containing protein [Chitinophaga sp. YR627]SFM85342.1 CarboxypepD_reg-like domain-containing protein [Chitinophaga sp. YR627]
MNKTKYYLLLLASLISVQLHAQHTIRGHITDSTGEPLPGAGIHIKGTQRGVATDENGAFVLPVPNGDTTLIFSYLGFISQERRVNNKTDSLLVVLLPTRYHVEERILPIIPHGREHKPLGYPVTKEMLERVTPPHQTTDSAIDKRVKKK